MALGHVTARLRATISNKACWLSRSEYATYERVGFFRLRCSINASFSKTLTEALEAAVRPAEAVEAEERLKRNLAKTVAFVPEPFPGELRLRASDLINAHQDLEQFERLLIETGSVVREQCLYELANFNVEIPTRTLAVLPGVQSAVEESLEPIDLVRHEIFSLLSNTRMSSTLHDGLSHIRLAELVKTQAASNFKNLEHFGTTTKWLKFSANKCLEITTKIRAHLVSLAEFYARDSKVFEESGLTGTVLEKIQSRDLERIQHVEIVQELSLPRLESAMCDLSEALSVQRLR